MSPLGELEKKVMEVLWASSAPLTSGQLQSALAQRDSRQRELAKTTVLTVLSRLEEKRFVTRSRSSRPHVYRATTKRAHFVAELMHDALGNAVDREAVLARFVGTASVGDTALLRRMLSTGA